MDGESENREENAVGLSDLSGKTVFFGYFLLLATARLALRAGFAVRAYGAVGQQKKVTRAQARKLPARIPQETKTLDPRVRGDDGFLASGDWIAHRETIESSRLTPLLQGAVRTRAAA